MAGIKDIEHIYSTMDKIFRLSMGETGDFSCAKFDGDFSKSLDEAQRDKYGFIAEQLGLRSGSKLIDFGCGWGPVLNYATNKLSVDCIGLTLSEKQAQACKANGLKAYVKDCKSVKPSDFGQFDAAVSNGAFEHFCSVEDFQAGKQETIYRDFFKTVADLLPPGRKFYLQTMVFGKEMLDYKDIDVNAPEGTDQYILGLLEKYFPGSWLPEDADMVVRCAEPYFKLNFKESGRKDYIETINRWAKRYRAFNLKKYAIYLSLIPYYFISPEFRYKVKVLKTHPMKTCFERNLMDQYRFTFEKK